MQQYAVSDQVTAEEIRSKRKELGFTQKELAEFVGVSKPTVERWEASEIPVTGPIALLLKILTREYVQSVKIPEKTLPLRLFYMYKDKVCTIIDVDEPKRTVKIKNYTSNKQFMAFGANTEPGMEDYEEFLKSRCFPETRDKMKLVLKDLEIPFYDPFTIIEKTEGRMAEDDFWIRIER